MVKAIVITLLVGWMDTGVAVSLGSATATGSYYENGNNYFAEP